MQMNLLAHIAATIKDLRVNYNSGEGLSQDALAKQLKVAPNTISRWETGTYCPSVTDVERIARFFSVSMMAFMPPEMLGKEDDEPQAETTKEPGTGRMTEGGPQVNSIARGCQNLVRPHRDAVSPTKCYPKCSGPGVNPPRGSLP